MTKEDLRDYRRIKRLTDRVRDRILVLETMIYSPQTGQLTGMPRGTTAANDRRERIIDKLQSLRETYQEKLEDLMITELEIIEAVSQLPAREQEVVEAYYIDGKKWDKVARDTHQSLRTVYSIHGRALQRLKEI